MNKYMMKIALNTLLKISVLCINSTQAATIENYQTAMSHVDKLIQLIENQSLASSSSMVNMIFFVSCNLKFVVI